MEVGCPHWIVTPSGTLYFNQPTGDTFVLKTIGAADGGGIRRTVVPLSGVDGGVVPDGYMDALYPSFAGFALSFTGGGTQFLSGRETLRANMRSYLRSILRADGTWKWLPAGGNLIPNGGFENDVSGWGLNAGGAIAQSSAQHQDGAKSAQVTMTTTAFSGVFSNTYLTPQTVVPGATYTVSMALKRTIGSGNVSIGLQFFDALGGSLATTSVNVSPTGTFASYGLTASAPAGTDTFSVELYNASGVAQTIFMDCVKVEYGSTATPYVEPGSPGYVSLLQRTVRLHMAPEIPQADRIDNFQFALVAADPAAYGSVQHTSADLAVGGAAVNVTNAGDIPTYPTIRIYGAVTNPTVTNNTTGLAVVFNSLTIANGAYVDVDCRLGRSILSTDGSSKASGINKATNAFWPLVPGVNAVQFAGSSSSGGVKANVIWRDAWAG